jgi:hypothetical protein
LKYESLIQRGRNTLCGLALNKPEVTHVFFIDGDIKWHPYDVLKLLNNDKQLVGGLYPKKNIVFDRMFSIENILKIKDNKYNNGLTDEQIVKHHLVDYNLNFSDNKKINTDGTMEVKYIATGFMMIKREVFDKMDNKKKIVNDLIALIRKGDEQKVSSFIDTIVNFISASEYNKQLNLALNNNDDKSLSNIIYQLLVEKLNDQDNIIKKIGRKLRLNINDKNIDAVKNAIMLGTATGQIAKLEKKLLENKEGKLVLNEIKKNSINVINDVKSTLANLSIIPRFRGSKKSSISTNSLNDIKDGNLNELEQL